MLVPPPDNDAPGDLIPAPPARAEGPGDDSSGTGSELLRLWRQARNMIRELDVRDAQIAGWFWRYYRCRVGLSDFDGGTPPEKITIEHLRRFCEAVERHGPRT